MIPTRLSNFCHHGKTVIVVTLCLSALFHFAISGRTVVKCAWTRCRFSDVNRSRGRMCPEGISFNHTSQECETRMGNIGVTHLCCSTPPKSSKLNLLTNKTRDPIAKPPNHPDRPRPTTVKPTELTSIPRCREARQQSFPFQVALMERKAGGKGTVYFCSGTIVSENFVLTAGHCLFDPETQLLMSESDIIVSAGDHNLQKMERTEQRILVEQIILHKEYDPSNSMQYWDIALLKLTWPFNFNENVSAIALPPVDFDANKLKKATVAGWADADSMPNKGYPVLQRVDVPIVSHQNCAQLYRDRIEPQGLDKIYPDQICTVSDALHDTCRRDSGGPLICRGEYGTKYICGVASMSSDAEEIPNIYTDAAWFRSWIDKNIHENNEI